MHIYIERLTIHCLPSAATKADINHLKEIIMTAVDTLNAELATIKASTEETIADIQAVKVTLAALQTTIADLEAQLANAGIPQETLDLAASVRALAEQAAAELPTVPAP